MKTYIKEEDVITVHDKRGDRSIVIRPSFIHATPDGGLSLVSFKKAMAALESGTEVEIKAGKLEYRKAEAFLHSWQPSGKHSVGIKGAPLKPGATEGKVALRWLVGGGWAAYGRILRDRRNTCLATVDAETAASDDYGLSVMDIRYLAAKFPSLAGVKGEIAACSPQELKDFLKKEVVEMLGASDAPVPSMTDLLAGRVFTRDENGFAQFPIAVRISDKEKRAAESAAGDKQHDPDKMAKAAERRERARLAAEKEEAEAREEFKQYVEEQQDVNERLAIAAGKKKRDKSEVSLILPE